MLGTSPRAVAGGGRRRAILDAAASLHAAGMLPLPAILSERTGLNNWQVRRCVASLRKEGHWPYPSMRGRKAGETVRRTRTGARWREAEDREIKAHRARGFVPDTAPRARTLAEWRARARPLLMPPTSATPYRDKTTAEMVREWKAAR